MTRYRACMGTTASVLWFYSSSSCSAFSASLVNAGFSAATYHKAGVSEGCVFDDTKLTTLIQTNAVAQLKAYIEGRWIASSSVAKS